MCRTHYPLPFHYLYPYRYLYLILTITQPLQEDEGSQKALEHASRKQPNIAASKSPQGSSVPKSRSPTRRYSAGSEGLAIRVRVWDLRTMEHLTCDSLKHVEDFFPEISQKTASVSRREGTCVRGHYAVTNDGEEPSSLQVRSYNNMRLKKQLKEQKEAEIAERKALHKGNGKR